MGAIDVGTGIIIAFKYRFRAILIVLSCIALALVASIVMQKQYEATAQILVKIGRELIYRSDVGNTQQALPTIDKDDVLASNIQLMRNADTERDIINTIGLSTLYPKLDAPPSDSSFKRLFGSVTSSINDILGNVPESKLTRAMKQLDASLKIETIKKTDVVAISFFHTDPVIAARVANMVVDAFQHKVGQLYDNPNLEFMQRQVDEQRAALAQVEEKLNTYRRQNKVYAFDSQMDLLLKQKSQLDGDMKSAEAHVAELKDLLGTLTSQRASTPRQTQLYSDTERHRATDDSQGQLLSLRLQEKQYSARYNDNYQPLIDLRNQIRLAESTVSANRADGGAQRRVGLNDTYQQLDQETLRRQADLAATTARVSILHGQLDNVASAIEGVSSHQRELLNLQHDIDLRTDAVRQGYEKLVEARTVQGLNQEKPASFSLVAAATPPDRANPVRPLPLLYTVAAAIAGIALASFVVFMSARLSDSFVTPKQALRRLNLPVLAVINYSPDIVRMARNRQPDAVAIAAPVERRAVSPVPA